MFLPYMKKALNNQCSRLKKWCECWDSNPERSRRRAMFYPIRLHSHGRNPFLGISLFAFRLLLFPDVPWSPKFSLPRTPVFGHFLPVVFYLYKIFDFPNLPIFSSLVLRAHFGYRCGFEPRVSRVGV